MKKKLFLLCILCLCSCNKNNRTSSSSEENYDDIDFKYTWNIKSNAAYSGTLEIYAGTTDPTFEDVFLHINNQEYLENITTPKYASFNYVGTDIKGDTSQNAADYFYLNQERLGKVPSDGAVGMVVDEAKLKYGENVVTLTIGQLWSTKEYDETLPHGNAYQSCDDYKVKDFHLTLPTGESLYPARIRKYYPEKVGVAALNHHVVIETEYDPTVDFWIGDGWGNADTYYGHSNERFNIPYKVDFVFDYNKPSFKKYIVNTKDFTDGKYSINLYEGKTHVQHSKVLFDNTKPLIHTTLNDYALLNKNTDMITTSFEDTTSSIMNSYSLIDGKATLMKPSIQNLENGWHTLTLFAMDRAGNYNFKFIPFYTSENGKFAANMTKNTTDIIITSENPFSAEEYKGIEYQSTSYYCKNFQSKDKVNLPLETTEEKDMPYHYFETEITDKTKPILLEYDGTTLENEKLVFNIYNYKTREYEKVATRYGEGEFSLILNPSDYLDEKNSILTAYVTLDYVDNGSDTMIWVTDTQHYTKFADLNEIYYQQMEYSVSLYNEKKAGYLIHTGDLVDDSLTPTSSDQQKTLVYKQWDIADKAHKILEDAQMPYGVVTGNHDTGTNIKSLNYGPFSEYFGAKRFNDKAYFGGHINDNASHYDLITIADTDFLILYLGYGVEGDMDTISWANDVLQRYPHRNAIICTHSYLLYNNGNSIPDPSSRYETIYNDIVVPNENVLMVLCGHENGAYRRKVQVSETREIYEILSDYQFVDEDPQKHYIGNYAGCNGEGYLRLMTFSGNKMMNKTYSPYRNKYNAFGNQDEFEITLNNMVQGKRQLITNAYHIYGIDEQKNTFTSTDNKVTIHNSTDTLIIKVYDNQNNETYIVIQN